MQDPLALPAPPSPLFFVPGRAGDAAAGPCGGANRPVFRAPSPPKLQLRATGSERAEEKIFKVPEERNGAPSDTTLDGASMSASVQAMMAESGG